MLCLNYYKKKIQWHEIIFITYEQNRETTEIKN